jgi:membrane protein YdbS with pleckstrin-like domain
VTVVVAAVVGLGAGLAIRSAALRKGATPVEATRNQRAVVSIALLIGAVALVSIALTDDHHRYVSLAVAAFMVVAAVWQLRDVRRADRNP